MARDGLGRGPAGYAGRGRRGGRGLRARRACRSSRRAATPGWSAAGCRPGSRARWCCPPAADRAGAGGPRPAPWSRRRRDARRGAAARRRRRLAFGVDFAARDSATVGGAIATNAGGLRVLRWGPARAQLVGRRGVLATARVLSRLDGPLKDNTGYDLSGLLVRQRGHARGAHPGAAAAGAAAAGRAGGGAGRRAGGGRGGRAARPRVPRGAGARPDAAELVGAPRWSLDVPARACHWPARRRRARRRTCCVGRRDRLGGRPRRDALAGRAGVGDAVLAADAADRARLGATARSSPRPISARRRAAQARRVGPAAPAGRRPAAALPRSPAASRARPSCSDTWPRATCTSTCSACPRTGRRRRRPVLRLVAARRRVDQRRARHRPGQGAAGCT